MFVPARGVSFDPRSRPKRSGRISGHFPYEGQIPKGARFQTRTAALVLKGKAPRKRSQRQQLLPKPSSSFYRRRSAHWKDCRQREHEGEKTSKRFPDG